MQTIWKFPFPITDKFSLEMPLYSEVIHVDVQPGVGPCMWAKVDPLKPKVRKWFHVTGTGHEVPPGAWHIWSFQQPPCVWHLWGALESHQERERESRLRHLPIHRQGATA